MARETQGSPSSEKKLERYGVWVKVGPREVTTAPVVEESFELSDLEAPKAAVAAPALAEDSALTAEEEKLLDELETELEPEIGTANVLVPEEEPLLEEMELPDIEAASGSVEAHDIALGQSSDEELPELEEDQEPVAMPGPARRQAPAPEPAEVEVTLSEDGIPEDHFDDLQALESELASVTSKPRDASASSAQILARIEDELRSIRTDLTQLRHELSGLRKTAAEAPSEKPSADAESQGGFLDEDEDETIALTGDELDNILNTAEITEEVADAAGTESPLDLTMELPESTEGAESQADVLSFETPVVEPAPLAVEQPEIEITDVTATEDETLVLTDDELLPLGDQVEASAPKTEELPADLVLEELGVDEEPSAAPAAKGADAFPEIDLEGIPEIETPPADSGTLPSLDEEGSETIDLETLDLGEEPKVIDAVSEQIDEAEALLEPEDLVPSPPAGRKATPTEEEPADEVDLEALALEAEELDDKAPVTPVVEDLEIGELETLADEAQGVQSSEKEIEINFESVDTQDAEVLGQAEPTLELAEELPEAEEVTEGVSSGQAAPAEIPDNLKDEIRTVLKYMDHLLEALPDEKIQEFASSDYFVMYKKLFEDLGLGE